MARSKRPKLPPLPPEYDAFKDDPKVIGVLLALYHDTLPERWDRLARAQEFRGAAEIEYPTAFEAFVAQSTTDLLLHELGKLEEHKRRAARKLQQQQLAQQRAKARIRAERKRKSEAARRVAEASGEEYTEPDDLDDVDDSEVQEVKSIFDLITNDVGSGENKRLGSWTLRDMQYVERGYEARALGYWRYGSTVSELRKRFVEQRDLQLAAAKKAKDRQRIEKLENEDLTADEVLGEAEVRAIWSDEVIDPDDLDAPTDPDNEEDN